MIGVFHNLLFITKSANIAKIIENTYGVEFTQEDINEIMKRAINEKLERENIIRD